MTIGLHIEAKAFLTIKHIKKNPKTGLASELRYMLKASGKEVKSTSDDYIWENKDNEFGIQMNWGRMWDDLGIRILNQS